VSTLRVGLRLQLLLFALALVMGVAALFWERPAVPPLSAAHRPIAIVGATVVHPSLHGAPKVEPDTTVLIIGDRISAVGPSSTVMPPPGAAVVDAHGKWIVPAYMDAHVHLYGSGDPYARPDVIDLTARMPWVKEALWSRDRAFLTLHIWLACGVTTLVDMGDQRWIFPLRRAVEHMPDVPRIFVTGQLISPVRREVLWEMGNISPMIFAATPQQARAGVREDVKAGADLIKFWMMAPFTELRKEKLLLEAAGREAHAAHRLFAVHACSLDKAKSALRAGADILAHSVLDLPIDDEFLSLAKKRDIAYIPTIYLARGVRAAIRHDWKPTPLESRLGDPEVVCRLLQYNKVAYDPSLVVHGDPVVQPLSPKVFIKTIAHNLRRVRDAGLTVALGTDSGYIGTIHGPSIFSEMDCMAKAGLTPAQVLAAATIGGARALHLENVLGDIQPGRYADLLILDADPLKSTANLSHIVSVMKGGTLFDRAALLRQIRQVTSTEAPCP